MTRQRKENAKEIDQEALLKKTGQQNDNMPEKQGKVHLKKKIVLRVSTAKEEIAVTIEIVIIGISRIANTSRNINAKWGKDCPVVHTQKTRYQSKRKW